MVDVLHPTSILRLDFRVHFAAAVVLKTTTRTEAQLHKIFCLKTLRGSSGFDYFVKYMVRNFDQTQIQTFLTFFENGLLEEPL